MNVSTLKVSNLKEMLTKFFWGCDSRSKVELERKAEQETIDIACIEKLLFVEQHKDGSYHYRITPKGKKYMYESQK